MEMKKPLGDTDLEIFRVVFGGNVFGWTADENQSFKLLDAFVKQGGNCIDTADVYSRWADGNQGGESETILGQWMNRHKNRQQLIIATKVGSDMGNGRKGLRKKYILEACDASLKRLQTDYIDLYQTHFDDESTPVAETLDAYDQLIRDGKVRYIGASNMTPERLRESLECSAAENLPFYKTLQPHYNLYAREQYETLYEPICLGHGLGVITYYSLQSGFLSGKYRDSDDLDKSVRGKGMAKYLDDRGRKILEALDKVAAELDTSPATIALAWLINRPSVTAPIASATSESQLNELMASASLELNADYIRYLNSMSTW